MSMSMSLEKLLLMRAAVRSPSRFDFAVELVLTGIKVGSIRNVDYQDAKATLSRAADDAWKNQVSDPFFSGGRWRLVSSFPKNIDVLYGSAEVMAKNLAARNIQVNAIAPGYFPSKMTAGIADEINNNALKTTPMARWGSPEDMAGVALFLGSKASGYLCGATVTADGGYATTA